MADTNPQGLELHGRPRIGPRLGKKAGFVVSAVVMAAIGLVMYGIVTRDAPDKLDAAKAPELTPATNAGRNLYEGVGDGVLGRQAPQVVFNESPYQPSPSVPQLQPAPAAAPAAPKAPREPTAEELAAARLRELRAQERLKAIESGSAVAFGGMGGGIAAAPTAQSDNALRAAALQTALGRSLGAAGGAGASMGDGIEDDNGDQNIQAHKERFRAAAEQKRAETLSGTRRLASSAFELKAGTVIPTILLTGMNSDLPGEVIGQVSENVFDSATGTHLLIPQGARVFGRYDSRVAYGQDRALVAWDRLIYPDGSSLTLEGMGGADKAGYSGFHDQVNNHIWRLLGYGAISALFSSVFQITQKDDQSDYYGRQSSSQVAAAEVARQFSQLGIQMAQRNLNIQPTIEIRPGYQFVVMVNKDVVFPQAYKEMLVRQ